ncbi:MAG: alpha/beta fold hydrolase [Rhodoferax sp.]|jgi:pimeloyl-ACP methyl ester carboxylesterase|nr:alpha/beta fold hydrolase [Rhodoferax sp.]
MDPLTLVAALERQAHSRVVDVPGVTVSWRRFGTGPHLVLLHGGHGSWLHWVRNIEFLARHFSVWVPDLPGYGASALAHPAGDLDALVRATADSLDVLIGAGTPFRLAGFSFGGLVATRLAALRPGVTQLALLGSAGHGTARRPRGKLLEWKAAARSGDAAALAGVMRHNLGVHMLHAQGDAIDALALHVHTVSCLHTRFRSRHLSLAAHIGPTLGALPARLWLAWGEHDVTADPPAVMATLATTHPSRSARIIDGAGHWIQYERADILNAMLLDWLFS